MAGGGHPSTDGIIAADAVVREAKSTQILLVGRTNSTHGVESDTKFGKVVSSPVFEEFQSRFQVFRISAPHDFDDLSFLHLYGDALVAKHPVPHDANIGDDDPFRGAFYRRDVQFTVGERTKLAGLTEKSSLVLHRPTGHLTLQVCSGRRGNPYGSAFGNHATQLPSHSVGLLIVAHDSTRTKAVFGHLTHSRSPGAIFNRLDAGIGVGHGPAGREEKHVAPGARTDNALGDLSTMGSGGGESDYRRHAANR